MKTPPENAYFDDLAIDRSKHSARQWVGAPEGHLPLPEARRRAVEELTEAEHVLEAKDHALAEAQANLRKAIRARDSAYEARQEARAVVKRKQAHVAWVCSTDSPPEPAR